MFNPAQSHDDEMQPTAVLALLSWQAIGATLIAEPRMHAKLIELVAEFSRGCGVTQPYNGHPSDCAPCTATLLRAIATHIEDTDYGRASPDDKLFHALATADPDRD